MVRNYAGILSALCLILIAFSAGGCTTKRTGPVFGAVNELAEIDPSFRPGMEFLSGFDVPQAGETWQPDDWVLLGIKVTHEDQSNVWFVRMSTLPPRIDSDGKPIPQRVREFTVPFGVGAVKPRTRFMAPVGRLCIETYDRDGAYVQSSVRSVPECAPIASLMQMCRDLVPKMSIAGASTDAPESENADNVSPNSLASLTVMMQTVGMCSALQPIRDAVREQVIKVPTLMDVILSGLNLRLEAKMPGTEIVVMPGLNGVFLGPCEQSHFPVCLAGQPLFDCRLISGPTAPPYHLTAGMLLFEAVHPEKPQNRLTVRVLAAKRLGPQASAELAKSQS